MTLLSPQSQSGRPASEARRPDALVRQAREHERAGRVDQALRDYQCAIDLAGVLPDDRAQVEALRRLAVLRHQRNEERLARSLCERSYELALRLSDPLPAAEALNTMALFDFESGDIPAARQGFARALERGGTSGEFRGRVLQNLGILANVEGDWESARGYYQQSLEAFLEAGDERGCAIAYHNLGMISADRGRWEDADHYFRESHAIATRLGDLQLQGLCLLNHAEIHIARQRYDEAMDGAEAALRIFDQLGIRLARADAYKVIGTIFRETGRLALAESRLRAAIELAQETGSVLSEAEASRELALLYQLMGRNQETLRLLNAAYRLFGRLNARVDLVDVGAKTADLEGTYLRVVREWGQSIESADSYTFGHCERVADYAVAVARALGLDEAQQTTIRLGAYLHDVGKVRVPHEILNKPGKLTAEEFAVVQQHPVWGVELLAAVEFPWDIKPIIRWHHERYDGTGYPDKLAGDEIPLGAQIICIVDVYDALTTTRSYRPAMSSTEALATMSQSRHWWRPDVFDAFLRVQTAARPEPAPRPATPVTLR